MIASDAGRQHGRMSPGLKGGVTSPEHPSSEVGSEYDDIDYGDDHESEAGDINFAGVTSDLEVRGVSILKVYVMSPYSSFL